VLLVALVFFATDWGSTLAGGSNFPGGPLDETAHLLTTLLVFWAIGRRADRYLVPALVASVVIDVDHLPGRLGSDWLTAGTPRPYTHSLLTVLIVLLAAGLWRRRRDLLLGVAIGLTIHFWRDLADPGSGVSILWPASLHPFAVSHRGYLLVMVVLTGVGAFRARPQPRPVRGQALPQE
jgi:inner membrane protein